MIYLIYVIVIFILILFNIPYQSTIIGGYEYPYRRTFMTTSNVMEAFNNIKQCKFKLIQKKYTIINMPNYNPTFKGNHIICEVGDDYEKMNWLSDWFNEKCRLKCKRYDEAYSPYEYFKQNNFSTTNPRELSDKIYSKVIGCNNFRPGLMVGAIKYFGAKSVLDFSSGWGDRLIGAIASDVYYIGVDPNDCVHNGYNEILETFGGKAKLIKSPFQTADIGCEKVDLVFTSPPYFDLESYSHEKGQSNVDYPNINNWFNDFLIVSLKKAWSHLNEGGHMVIIINDIKPGGHHPTGIQYVEKMIKEMELEDSLFLGTISYAEFKNNYYKSPQPMWIWKKIKPAYFDEKISYHKSANKVDLSHLGVSTLIDCNWELVPDGGWVAYSENNENNNENTENVINSIDSVYYGCIYFNFTEYKIWKKQKLIQNPQIVFTLSNIVRDDLLPGGTNQRGCDFKNIINKEIVYVGNGIEQVAVAIGCKIYNKKATIFSSENNYTIRAKIYGANVICHGKKILQDLAEKYALENNAYLISFDNKFKSSLENAISNVMPITDFSKNIWVITKSDILIDVLHNLFPHAKIENKYDVTNADISHISHYLPPYTSLETCEIFIKDAKDGDIIWVDVV